MELEQLESKLKELAERHLKLTAEVREHANLVIKIEGAIEMLQILIKETKDKDNGSNTSTVS